MTPVDRTIIGEERRLMEEIEPELTKIFKDFTGGSKVWLTTDFFKKVYRETCLAQLVICSLYEEVNSLNATVKKYGEYIDRTENERIERLPKKAKISLHGTTDWNTRCRCPVCNKDLFDSQKYCSECGQKIDWGKGKVKT